MLPDWVLSTLLYVAGHCVVDQTEKGWFITYIDRDPETIQRQEALAKKDKMDLDDEERVARFVKKQVAKAKIAASGDTSVTYTEFSRDNEDEKGGSLNFFSHPSLSPNPLIIREWGSWRFSA